MTRTSTALRRLHAQQIPARTVPSEDHIQARNAALAVILEDREQEHPATSVRASKRVREPSRTRPRWRTRTLIVTVAAATLMATALVIVTGGGHPATAQTPPLLTFQQLPEQQTTGEVLERLASIAEEQPALTSGPYLYAAMRGWYLSTSQTLDGPATNEGIVDTLRESWRSSTGAIRLVQTTGGQQTVSYLDQPIVTGYENLPSETQPLHDVLRYLHTQDDGPGTMVGAVADAWSAAPTVPPALNAGLLRVLAHEPGLTILGTVTDRAGRPGIAIAGNIDAGYTEQRILVVSPTTGKLLSYETVLLSGDVLPVDPPATTGYTLWLDRAFVATDTAKP